ncbi:MAG: non-canonical purine NTP pyrophosphatase, partial [Acidobacteriota bacterium]
AQGHVEIQTLEGLERLPACVEDGATFEENAVKKALHYSVYAPGPLFADDSGLEVDALGGAPGVISARYSGPGATDRSNNALLVEKLRGVANRAARFVCVIAAANEGRLLGAFRGEVEGRILDQPRGAQGFGYDPLFFYEPYACTFGEVDGDRKFQVSHRGRALRAMLDYFDRELFQRK